MKEEVNSKEKEQKGERLKRERKGESKQKENKKNNMKEQIYNQLFMSRSKSIIDNWFEREESNYYILENI